MNCNPLPEVTCGNTNFDSCIILTGAWPACFPTTQGNCYRLSDFIFASGNQICTNVTAINGINNQLGFTGNLQLSGCTGFVPSNTTVAAEFQTLYSSLCTFQTNLDQPINTGSGGINLKCLAAPCDVPIGTLGQLLQALINSTCAESGLLFEALITQSGTTAPSYTILADTLDPTQSYLSLNYIGVGTYTLVANATYLPNAFPANATSIYVGSEIAIGQQVVAKRINNTTIAIQTASGGALNDGILNSTSLLIKIFS